MSASDLLVSERFPRSSRYSPEWILAAASGGAHPLWLPEWLGQAVPLQPDMRVLDLGAGRAASSIFLRREFGVQVWAIDLWASATENLRRIQDAAVADGVYPLRADARSLPFAAGYFDAVVSIDAYPYFGTDDLYLNYLAHFVRPDGLIAICGAGLVQEFGGAVPEHLRRFWTQDLWCLHSALWWRRHWERTGIAAVEHADTMTDGWQLWRDWQRAVAPDNRTEIDTLEADHGRYLGYIRIIARRRGEAQLEEYCWPDTPSSSPSQYTRTTLLREQGP